MIEIKNLNFCFPFIQEVGTNINPYLSSIFIGIVRAVMSVVNTYMLKTFHRRPLIIWSSLGMGACMLVSGLFTNWIKTGESNFYNVFIVSTSSNIIWFKSIID